MRLSQKDIKQFFHPESICIVGVSIGDYRFGGMSFLMKLQDCNYPGKLYPINPKAHEILGLKAYPDLLSLPELPDLAILCLPAGLIPSMLKECAQIGLRHIHILTSGFKETGTKEGKKLEDQIAAISKKSELLVIGPNCMGPYCPASNLTAWGAIPGLDGPLGIISQSGYITQRLTEYLCSLGIGVEKAVSFGNAAVLDCTDFLEMLAQDEKIRVIAIYLESVQNCRSFFHLAREVSVRKPIILWKGGESEVGAATAASHTGGMSGEQKLWAAFYRQTGVIHVQSMNECVDTIVALALLPAPDGRSVFLIGAGGGNSVVNSDICIQEGLEVPRLSQSTMECISKSVHGAGFIAGNPFDMYRVFQDVAYLAEILDLAYKDPAVSMIIVDRLIARKAFHTTVLNDSTPETIKVIKRQLNRKPTVFTVDSDGGDSELAKRGAEIRAKFCKARIPAYPTMKRAARAMFHLYSYHSMKKSDNN